MKAAPIWLDERSALIPLTIVAGAIARYRDASGSKKRPQSPLVLLVLSVVATMKPLPRQVGLSVFELTD